MKRIERLVPIKAPVEKVFSYIVNPASELEYVPGATNVQDITGHGVGQRWGWTYKMLGVSFKGISEVIEFLPNERYIQKSTGGIASTWDYTFKPEDGETRLNLVVEYDIPIPVLGKIAERLVLRQNEREADLAMATLKDILED